MRAGVWHNRAVGVYPLSPVLHADASRFRPLALVCECDSTGIGALQVLGAKIAVLLYPMNRVGCVAFWLCAAFPCLCLDPRSLRALRALPSWR